MRLHPQRDLPQSGTSPAAGLFAGVVMTPVLPFLEDTKENVMGMVELAREAGARFIYPMFSVTLKGPAERVFYSRLDRIFPDMGLHERYEKQYSERYVSRSPKAGSLYRLLGEESRKSRYFIQNAGYNSFI